MHVKATHLKALYFRQCEGEELEEWVMASRQDLARSSCVSTASPTMEILYLMGCNQSLIESIYPSTRYDTHYLYCITHFLVLVLGTSST